MEQFEVDTLVIGAGVIGLAVARELALRGRDVWLLEREAEIGMQTSSRNSEVIHAGIYYPKGSLKAKLCVEGKQRLYAYCEANSVPVNRCGKVIVAGDVAQTETLKSIHQKAVQNGVDDLVWLDEDELSSIEPDLKGVAGLLSPSTGTIDSHAYMMQLLADFENAGGQLVLIAKLVPCDMTSNKMVFEIEGQNACIVAKRVVNAAGLQAIDLFSQVDGYPLNSLPVSSFAKGSYFSYRGQVPFKHLVYPVPEPGGLGVHLTLDMAGTAKFGPDVEWLEDDLEFDYQVDPEKHDAFLSAIRSYWPSVDATRLVPDYSGIRPKVSGKDELPGDFIIQGESGHGIAGLVNLFGIESPGLTASLAIADLVAEMLEK